MAMVDFLYWVGMAAVAVNALTGVLEAERKEVDMIGATFIAICCSTATFSGLPIKPISLPP